MTSRLDIDVLRVAHNHPAVWGSNHPFSSTETQMPYNLKTSKTPQLICQTERCNPVPPLV